MLEYVLLGVMSLLCIGAFWCMRQDRESRQTVERLTQGRAGRMRVGYETIPVLHYEIHDKTTGDIYAEEFYNFDLADEELQKARLARPKCHIELLAVVDA